jgi:hypothetical protein
MKKKDLKTIATALATSFTLIIIGFIIGAIIPFNNESNKVHNENIELVIKDDVVCIVKKELKRQRDSVLNIEFNKFADSIRSSLDPMWTINNDYWINTNSVAHILAKNIGDSELCDSDIAAIFSVSGECYSIGLNRINHKNYLEDSIYSLGVVSSTCKIKPSEIGCVIIKYNKQ